MQVRIYKKDNGVIIDVSSHSWERGKFVSDLTTRSEYIITDAPYEVIKKEYNSSTDNYYDFNLYTNYIFHLHPGDSIIFTAVARKYKTYSCYLIYEDRYVYKIEYTMKQEIIIHRIDGNQEYVVYKTTIGDKELFYHLTVP